MAVNIQELMALADHLDSVGKFEEADKVDNMIKHITPEVENSTKCTEPVIEAKEANVFEKLTNISDRLDKLGATEEADLVDGIIEKLATDVERKEEADTEQSKRYDSKHHHSLQIREPKTKQERVDREGRENHHVHTMQQTNAMSLSTRYCPEHVGVPVYRVGESTYQCSMDGAIFNYETGWTDFDGNEHPGGSVAAQTPDSSGHATPHRIFDSRENILNTVNR